MRGIATMAEPSTRSLQRSVIVNTHGAREMLSLCERAADQFSKEALDDDVTDSMLIQARHLAGAARATLADLAGTANDHAGLGLAGQYLHRCTLNAEASQCYLKLFRSYMGGRNGPLESDRKICEKRAENTRRQWRRSAREAKKEAHQALAALCEAFPDAYETEDAP